MKLFAVVFFLILVPFSASQAACDDCAKDVAIFVSEKSVWPVEVEALHKFFAANGLSVAEVTAQQLNQGVLGSGARRAFKTVVMPGGYLGLRTFEINEGGRRSLRDFIATGGDYIGICAGAAYAACGFKVALALTEKTEFHPADHYVEARYNLLEIWPGSVQSPYEWAPFLRGATIEPVDLSGPDRESRMYYHAGPALLQDFAARGRFPPQDLEIWGRVRAPNDGRRVLPPQPSAAGKPSIVKFNYGAGRVVLFSQHPVFAVDPQSDRINTSLLRRAFDIRTCESLFIRNAK